MMRELRNLLFIGDLFLASVLYRELAQGGLMSEPRRTNVTRGSEVRGVKETVPLWPFPPAALGKLAQYALYRIRESNFKSVTFDGRSSSCDVQKNVTN
jgi:hypothetical protein